MKRIGVWGLALGLTVMLGIVGCGKGSSSSPPPPSGPPPGMMMPPPPPRAQPEPKKEETAKAEKDKGDDSDNPWAGEKKTVRGAIGKALLRGFTSGGKGAAGKQEELPTFAK